jgi:hypothetical protein
MPQHSCAAGLQFGERVLNAHMQVAFPGLGSGGFEEAVVMRGTGFASLNLLLELAVARCAELGKGNMACRVRGQADTAERVIVWDVCRAGALDRVH